MIRIAKAEDLAFLHPESEAAVRIMGLVAAYGTDQPFIRLWCDSERRAFISLMDGYAVLEAADDADFEELAVFLDMQTEITGIRTSLKTARKINVFTGWTIQHESVMTSGPDLKAPDLKPAQLTPREVYPLLQKCFDDGLPPFESWYVDVSHRIRHGCCRVIGFRHDGFPVSCAMTISECRSAAIIGAVATIESGRGRGYASANVLTLTHHLIQEGKKVLLSPKNWNAHQLYLRLGFIECGSWGNLYKTTGRIGT